MAKQISFGRSRHRLLWTVVTSALFGSATAAGDGAVVIDHTAVDRYATIPVSWRAAVNTMLLNYPGESHGRGLLYGLELLEVQDSRFAVDVAWTGGPPAETDEHLRVFRTHYNGVSWQASTGEEDTWTHSAALARIHDHLLHCADLSTQVDAFSWAWCWDMEWQSPGCDENGWAGRVYTDFAKETYTDYWDIEATGPCLVDYLTAWAGFSMAHSETAIVYTTGPVDGATGCRGYQRWLKNNAIRAWATGDDRYLFDYADILAHNDDGELCTVSWEDNVYPRIHPDNAGNHDGGHGGSHIGANGCLRLGKAAWVLLAEIAGWDGLPLGDFDGDGDVDVDDLNLLLNSYDADAGGDLDNDGDTDFDDLNILLAHYGT